MSFRENSEWAARMQGEVKALVVRHLDRIVSVRLASREEDAKRATDMVVEVAGGTVAVRVRDTTRDFRDWTVRSRLDSGTKTELAKLREGFARWYLYAWCAAGGGIGDYVLIDLDLVRAKGLLGVERRERSADGWKTAFIAVPVAELRSAGCLAVDRCTSPCVAPRHDFVPAASVKAGRPAS